MTRKSLLIIPLIALVGFLFFSKIGLVNGFENITPEEAGKYLELPREDAEKILDSLHQVFVNKGIDLITSTSATDEQIAVIAVLNKISKIHILNHLLVDAPIEITGKIIKTAIDMARLFGAQDISVVLDKFEKETVKMAIDYATKKLVQDEIKVTPGAIQFKYKSYQGEQKEVILQYIIIYQSLGDKKGKVEIRFYSPSSIERPDIKTGYGGLWLVCQDLNHDLPPFITEIQGTVEKKELGNYGWVEGPSIKITFPDSVPDFGIKPLTFWERHLLKPIETAIGNIDVVITKATGKSPNLVNTWNKIKAAISNFIPLSPAAIVETQPFEEKPEIEEPLDGAGQEISELKLTLAEIQGKLDSVLEKMETIGATNKKEISESEEAEEEKKEEEKKEEEKKEDEEEEKVEEADEEEVQITLCEKTSGNSPVRNEIIINEVAWMGGNTSASDEWIELKNLSSSEINLAGWQLLDKEKQIKVVFFTREAIPSKGFFLLERADDDSVPNVIADFIYTGTLSNTNEALYLFDENCQLQDEALANPDWPAGDNSSKRTMERKSNLGWQTSANPEGTPKNANSEGYSSSSGGGSGSGGYSPPTPPPPPPPPPSDT
ncbi:MAG: lamin tail domain-containing protein, partial [Candidatus Nealsonbacteria bacterium]